jgi:DNA-directed RNA polymerase specialized sigma subunit
MFKTLRATGIMAKKINLRSLTKSEQLQLWQDFMPLKLALASQLKNGLNGFRGGWKKLNLKAIRDTIPTTKEIRRAERAMGKLIDHNTAMVISEAHRKHRYNKHSCPDDLVQAGHIGLIYALYLYEPVVDGKEIKFSSYAYRWIKALIQEEIQGDKTIKPPSNIRKYSYRFVTAVHSVEGDSVDVFDMFDNEAEGELLSAKCSKVLTDVEYKALSEDDLMAMIELGVSWEELYEIRKKAKQKILASV